MPSVGTVLLADVWRALDVCLPGYRRVENLHHWWVYPPKGQPYRSLPKGEHGARKKIRIERGHAKKMANQFGVLKCFRENISGL